MKWPSTQPLRLLAAARTGDLEALGSLVELYRNYLHLLARVQVDRHLRRRLSPSDLVQETFARACRGFGTFRGESEQEFIAWLRSILLHALKKSIEREISTNKRSLRREVPLHAATAAIEHSSLQIDKALLCSLSTPMERAGKREMAHVVADRLAQLPENYREVIVLRNLEGLPFEEVAQKLGKSVGAARVLWVRALKRLRREMNDEAQDERR